MLRGLLVRDLGQRRLCGDSLLGKLRENNQKRSSVRPHLRAFEAVEGRVLVRYLVRLRRIRLVPALVHEPNGVPRRAASPHRTTICQRKKGCRTLRQRKCCCSKISKNPAAGDPSRCCTEKLENVKARSMTRRGCRSLLGRRCPRRRWWSDIENKQLAKKRHTRNVAATRVSGENERTKNFEDATEFFFTGPSF